MAAIGKIRSWGPVLVGVIGLALFAFIAEELVRGCDSIRNQSRQQIGEVLGKKIDYQEYQKNVDEYLDVIKITQGRENLTDEESSQVRDMVWNQLVQNTIMEAETKKLGITVTDDEMHDIFVQGTNPMLQQTPFVNQQTGRFDVNQLTKFRNDYQKAVKQNPQAAEQYRPMYNYTLFIEKTLRQQILAQKYQALLTSCMLSNPVSAKALFQAQNEESEVQLASFPYSAIKDDDVKVTDAELQAKYNELKPRFRQMEETRDIKYVDVKVEASDADRAAIDKEVKDLKAQLAEAENPEEVIRKSASTVPWLGIPQTRSAFPSDIALKLDSMAVGATSEPVENKRDNTLNVMKLIAKQQLPDSIEFRAITVAAADAQETAKRADSIFTALQGGADFEAIAKKYGQTGEKNWLTSQQYQKAPSMDADTRNYLITLNTAEVNALKRLDLTGATLILQVTGKKGITTKYTAAVIKKPIDFSKDTYNAAYNKFSQFVSENRNLEALQKNAEKYGYKVEEQPGVRTTEHNVAGVSRTREALRWLFQCKKGEVSQLYECGDNSDHLFVMVCDNINEKGFATLQNEQLKNYVKNEVIKDKKAEQILAKIKGVDSMSKAKQQGAVITDSLRQITFAAPVFVQATGSSEPALSGAIAGTKAGQFSKAPVKGNGGVFLFTVKEKKMREGAKFDEKETEKQARQRLQQRLNNFMQELSLNAEIKDNRYLFM
ncbi:MAG: SurA N-terminal domain-containing protein [Prevotella sp.]|nr:SurA N-terminal domain-containing protein [Prevotella sp.]